MHMWEKNAYGESQYFSLSCEVKTTLQKTIKKH